MSYDSSKVRAAIVDPANSALDSAGIAALFAPQTVRKPSGFYITYRSLMALPAVGQAKAEALAAYFAARAPATHQIMLQAGANDGSAGGMDITQDSTRAAIDGLVGQVPGWTTDDAAAVKALGETQSYPAGGPVAASDVDVEKCGIGNDNVRSWLNAHFTSAMAAIDTAQRGGQVASEATLQASFTPGS